MAIKYKHMGSTSTGNSGWGFDFEREVSCAFLVLMASDGCLWVGDEEVIKSVWPQVHKDIETDDIRVCLQNVSTKKIREMYIQCKATVECTPAKSSQFYKAVSKAFRDYLKCKGKNASTECVFALCCGPLPPNSQHLPEFLHDMHERNINQIIAELSEGRLEKEYKRLYSIFAEIARSCETTVPVTNELICDFIRGYYVLQPDIKYRFGIEESFMMSTLRHIKAIPPTDKLDVLRILAGEKAKARTFVERDQVLERLRIDDSAQTNAHRMSFNLANSAEQTRCDQIVQAAMELPTSSNNQLPDKVTNAIDNVKSGNEEPLIDILVDNKHNGELLYSILRTMAANVVSGNGREGSTLAAMRFLRYQRDHGTNGIAFDFFVYLLSPEIKIDSLDTSWRYPWLRELFRIDSDLAWDILCALIVSEKMPPISFVDGSRIGEPDAELIGEYKKYALELAANDSAKLTDLANRLPLVDREFFGEYLALIRVKANRASADYVDKISQSLLSSWAKILEWPFFGEQRIVRSQDVLNLVIELLGDKYEPILLQLYEVDEGYCDGLNSLREEYLQRYIADNGDNPDVIGEFAAKVRHSYAVGATLARIQSGNYDQRFFDIMLLRLKNASLASVAQAYAWQKYRHAGGMHWAEKVESNKWRPKQIAQFYALLPLEKTVWAFVCRKHPQMTDEYWRNVKIYMPDKETAADYKDVVLGLANCGRTIDSLTAWSYMVSSKINVPVNVTMTMMNSFLSGAQSVKDMNKVLHCIVEALKSIGLAENIDVDMAADIEWYFNAALSKTTFEYLDSRWCNIRMAKDPEFFIRVVKGVYRNCGDEISNDYSRGEKVLNAWNVFPGVDSECRFNASAFRRWWDRLFKKISNDTQCRNKCLSWIGICLAKIPIPNRDVFLWTDVWDFMNSAQCEPMFDGFKVTLKNQNDLAYIFASEEIKQGINDKYNQLADEAMKYKFYNIAKAYEDARARFSLAVKRDGQWGAGFGD